MEVVVSFGERLRLLREGRGLSLEQVERATRIRQPQLRALENNDFAALPGPVYAKGFVRAYAECVGAEPEPLVLEFERAWKTALGGDHGNDRVVREMASLLGAGGPRKRSWLLAVAGLSGVLLALAGWWLLGREAPDTPPPPAAPVSAAAPPPRTRERSEPAVRTDPGPGPAAPGPSEKPAVPATPAPLRDPRRETPDTRAAPAIPQEAGVRIAAHGVGRAVVGRELVGATDRFREGEDVAFWTRVLDGRGLTIRHVWIREGRAIDTIALDIGGPSWRTHSRKRMRAGSAGRWAVEARDPAGRVLARREFVVAPAPDAGPR